MNLPIGHKVIAIRDCEEGDWKTCLAGRKKLIPLKKGEIGLLCEIWNNFYGQWARVELKNGDFCDVNPRNLREAAMVALGISEGKDV